MTIALTTTQEQLIKRLVNSGRYSSASKALDAALQLLAERERHYAQWLEDTRQDVAGGGSVVRSDAKRLQDIADMIEALD